MNAAVLLLLASGLSAQENFSALRPMPDDADPSFEVATIKPSSPGDYLVMTIVGGRIFKTIAASAADLIAYGYGVHAKEIIGAPHWVMTQTFNLEAQPDRDGQPSSDQMRSMVCKLLADRFQLELHRETRDLPVYRIRIAKSGLKLKPALDPKARPGLGFRGRRGALTVKSATLADLAGFLQRYVLDRPVVDATNLPAKYDIDLNWRPDDTAPAGRISQELPVYPESANLPDFFTATQRQLGLRFEAAKASVPVLVIDRVSLPSGN
jgi:uncharacterized protein (TIGR03435 family)